jgi:transposase
LNLKTKKFYWKRSRQADSNQFIWFLTQLRQRTPKKLIVIILDNATIHKSKKVKNYLKNHENIRLFYLPPYSPEYNPVELFWKWIKPKVYGFSAFGGLQELIRRFRIQTWHYNHKTLTNPIKFNLNTYNIIL